MKWPRFRPITRRPRTRLQTMLVGSAATLAALAVAATMFLAWYDHETSGPGYDADLAATSLHRVLISSHPAQRLVSVHCDGLRDGSDFFGCQVARHGLAVASYSVSYSGKTHLYRAEGGVPTELLKFEPSK